MRSPGPKSKTCSWTPPTQVDPAQLGVAGRRARHRLDPHAAQRLARDEDAQHEATQRLPARPKPPAWSWSTPCSPAAQGALFATAIDTLAAPHPANDGTPDTRTKGKRVADAIVHLAELPSPPAPAPPAHYPPEPAHRSAATSPPTWPPCEPTSPAAAAQPAPHPPSSPPATPAAWTISPLTAQTLACDAETTPILLDDHGRVLDVGTTTYPFPPRIRKAIEQRDQHCTFPRCNAPPPWCHAHHLVPHPEADPPAKPTAPCSAGDTTATSTRTAGPAPSKTATSPGAPSNQTTPTTPATPKPTPTSKSTKHNSATSPNAGSPAAPPTTPADPRGQSRVRLIMRVGGIRHPF